MTHSARVVLLLSLVLVGCGGDAAISSDVLTTSVDSSGAVPVVTVTGEPPEWSLDTLAVVRAEPELSFSRVSSIALDPRGGVWVADVGEKRLSYWDDTGAHVEDRGRVGSGPSEFRLPNSIAVFEDGVYVLDTQNARIVRFALDAGADSSWLIGARLTGDPMSIRLYPDPSGPIMLDFVRAPTPAQSYLSTTTGARVAAPPRGENAGDTKVCQTPGGGIGFFPSPFAPLARMAPYGGQGVAAFDGDDRIDRFDASGTLVSRLVRPVRRDSVSDAEYADGLADWTAFQERTPGAACEGDIVRYREKPAIVALLPDPDGRLWVERRMPGRTVYELWVGDSLQALVPAPERLSTIPPAMLGDRIGVVAESPDGGHEVRLYRVRGGAAGPR